MDDESLRNMMEKNHTSAFGWALYCCKGDQDEAADLLHSVYIQILEKGKLSFSGKSSFKTWLFSVIKNTAKKRRFQVGQRLRKLQTMLFRPPVYNQGIETSFLENETRDRILILLKRLSQRQRQVLQLVFYHNLTLEESATVLNISIGSVRTHYERGKVRLRTEMQRVGWNHE